MVSQDIAGNNRRMSVACSRSTARIGFGQERIC